MIRSFIRWLRGYVRFRIEGYSPERFLNLCSFHGIYIWGLNPVARGYELYMSVSDFRKLKPFVRKTHTRIVLCQRYGFPFFVTRYRKRKFFFIGLFLCIVLLKVYSVFIWDIHFEGNEKWTDETLMRFLRSEGVSPCMLKSKVDCQGIVKAVRKEYNDIVWVSASIDGTRLKVQIKENEDTFHPDEKSDLAQQSPTDLIASCDGVITKIITRSGVPQVHVGDVVKKGDLLVLGRVEVLNDSQEITGYQYHTSDADVFADTQIEYKDEISLSYEKKVYDQKKRSQIFLRIWDKMISLGSIRNSYANSEVFTSCSQIRMGENFYLPIFYGVRTAVSYSLEEQVYSEEEVQSLLSANFERFCDELEEKGIQIRENSVKIQLYENSAVASGTVYLNERITETADTEILTVERKESDESVGTDN